MGRLVRTEGTIAAAEATEHNFVAFAETVASGLELLAERVRNVGIPSFEGEPRFADAATTIVHDVTWGVANLGLAELVERGIAAQQAKAALEAPEAAVRATERAEEPEERLPAPEDGLVVLAAGLVGISVCVPEDWSRERVEKEANAARPTGIRSEWGFRDEDGDVATCELGGRSHWSLTC